MESFKESDFWLDMNDVSIGKEIGEGQFSTVYIGKYFGDYVAVKKQLREDKGLDTYLMREIAVLKNCNHQHLVGYIGASNSISEVVGTPNILYIVTEFCQGGDLLNLILSDHPLGWRFRIRIAIECASALKYLHNHNLIHRDVKSSNILLDHNWTCKLSDFGMARELDKDGLTENDTKKMAKLYRRMTICGTNEYMAPELLFDEEYGAAVDVFSFGMVLLELMKRVQIGKQGFATRTPSSSFKLDTEAIQGMLPEDAPPSLVMLALQCCEYSAEDRPYSDDAHDWLVDLHDNTPEDVEPVPPMSRISETTDADESKSSGGGEAFGGGDFDDFLKTADDEPVTRAAQSKSSAPPLLPLTSTTNHLVLNYTKDQLRKGYGIAIDETTVLKEGHIHKKNNTGFRNWKSRWMVLTPTRVTWYTSSEDKTEKGFLDLKGITVRKTKQFRFVLLDEYEATHVYVSKHTGHSYHREFSADSLDSMEEWTSAIEKTVEVYSKQIGSLSRMRDNPMLAPEREIEGVKKTPLALLMTESQSNLTTPVEMFLKELDLSQYLQIFTSRGYTNMQHIVDFGISDDDLNYMNIVHPLHRRVLKTAGISSYSDILRTAIPEYQDIGSAVLYKVKSKWRFYCVTTLLRYSDIQKMHSAILKSINEAKECKKILEQFPDLPGKDSKYIQARNADFLNQRRTELEAYLHAVTHLLSGTPIMKIVHETLGLNPPMQLDSANTKTRNKRTLLVSYSKDFGI